ncbi:MAG: hypothetical protein J6V23_07075 [Bacteroidaceae bacterium]|nr:hypothetical protein [Bacteroidaceae bacterium]
MKNMTTLHFPILSPRQNRGIVKSFVNPQGILDKEELLWIDDQKLCINGEEKYLKNVTLSKESPKTLAKMGAYVIIMPDRVWYNVDKDECGYMEHSTTFRKGREIKFSMCEANGSAITWNDASYYESNKPKDGDYMMTTTNGKASLKVYSATTGIWATVATTYVQITASNIGIGFEKDDGVKLTIDGGIPSLSNIFVNEDENGKVSTNTWIVDKTDDSITIVGILQETLTITDKEFTIERKVPDMAFITECNNRLWGCSKDGHEIYCCKLGDVKNWNCFRGVSTDSWAATVGSDGKFTGAITYLGYPMFFKEDSLIKISPSSTGGHQTKETKCRGVQKGSHNSLSILNETLYYKSSTCVCAYNGSLPYTISDYLGDVRYYDAVAGSVGDRYYISMRDANNKYSMFVFDSKTDLWCKEDDTEVIAFCRQLDELYYIDARDNKMKSVRGTLPYDVPEKAMEGKFDWFVESGTIGYSSPDHKYVARINLRISLEVGTNVDFYLQYDSNGEWEHKFNMSGNGTRSFSVPIIPKRCDHFKYKLTGKGGCKIHSITKTLEEGSDI